MRWIVARAAPPDIPKLVGPQWEVDAGVLETLTMATVAGLEYYRKLGYVWWAGPAMGQPLAYAVAYEAGSRPKHTTAVLLHALVKTIDPQALETAQWLMAHLLQPAVLGSVPWYAALPASFAVCDLAQMLQQQFQFEADDGFIEGSLMLTRPAPKAGE